MSEDRLERDKNKRLKVSGDHSPSSTSLASTALSVNGSSQANGQSPAALVRGGRGSQDAPSTFGGSSSSSSSSPPTPQQPQPQPPKHDSSVTSSPAISTNGTTTAASAGPASNNNNSNGTTSGVSTTTSSTPNISSNNGSVSSAAAAANNVYDKSDVKDVTKLNPKMSKLLSTSAKR